MVDVCGSVQRSKFVFDIISDGVVFGEGTLLQKDGAWIYAVPKSMELYIRQRGAEDSDGSFPFEVALPIPIGSEIDMNALEREYTISCQMVVDWAEGERVEVLLEARPGSVWSQLWSRWIMFFRPNEDLPFRVVNEPPDADRVQTIEFPTIASGDFNLAISDEDFDEPVEWANYRRVSE